MNGTSLVSFDRQLLDHITNHENDEAKSILSKNLVNARDEFGTLLHYAALHGNEVITEYLIELGSEVDAIGEDGKTPLIIAVENEEEATVDMLLKAKANIDIADESGESALQMVLQEDSVVRNILKMFIHKVRADASSIEESIDKLVGTGCTLFHATYSRDVKMLECMLTHGFDVNSRGGPWQWTALHAAAELNDLGLAKWLVDKGADVNVLDENGNGALYYATEHGSKELLQFLLEQGADPNSTDPDGNTLLFTAVLCYEPEKQYAECVELLLDYGTVFQDESEDTFTTFDVALQNECFQVINVLIGHLAVLEKFGGFIGKSVILCNDEENREAFHQIKKDYELCLRTLNVVVFGTSTLFDLLRESDEQMKIHVRNETFLPKIDHFCFEHRLKESCSYFYNKLMKSICRADYLIKLENTGISVICDLFDADYNQCYIAARKICDYLDEPDLVQLSRLQI